MTVWYRGCGGGVRDEVRRYGVEGVGLIGIDGLGEIRANWQCCDHGGI